ncbi:transporter [Plantactinospora siamensis]|uniref:Transporter n=1 Tax=Plantactinospora siamensis TaxID=555372 RepID=A0ABV6P136_9ACTN
MIWLAWRQHRVQFLVALLCFAAVAAVMVVTGLRMRHAFADAGLPSCLPKVTGAEIGVTAPPPGTQGDYTVANCVGLARQLSDRYETVTGVLAILFTMLPLFVGLFFGAPLVAREVEQGTHRLVWTQGITRRRWALVKFGLVGAVTLALAGAFAALSTWWIDPLARATGRGFNYLFFDQRGIVPAAYTLFAVALGTAAGALWRKGLPAMAATLVTFLVVRVGIAALARPRFLPARRITELITEPRELNRLHGDWIVSMGVHRADGTLLVGDGQVGCPPGEGRCLREFGAGAYNQWLVQPVGRFWTFQWIETGIYVALAALLLWYAVHRVRRRIS